MSTQERRLAVQHSVEAKNALVEEEQIDDDPFAQILLARATVHALLAIHYDLLRLADNQ